MRSRRGVGVGATVLIAIVVLLATTLYFVTGHGLPGSQLDNSKGTPQLGLPAITNPSSNNIPATTDVASPPTNPVGGPVSSSSADTLQAQLAECASYSPPIPKEECNQATIMTHRKITFAEQTTQSVSAGTDSIKVSNAHAWVSGQNSTSSVIAFVIQNTGSRAVTINYISLRGLSVPTTSWYSCTTYCAIPTNINTDLYPQYTSLTSVKLPDGFFYPMTAGPISLTQGQATIVYIPGAGNLGPIDGGMTYSLQVQAGQAIAVHQVQVLIS